MKQGQKHSAETIQKMKKNHVGFSNKIHTEKTKQKMSKTRKGRKRKPFTEKWKKNISLASKGRKHSEETKIKISLATKGKPKSEQMKKRLSESRQGSKHPLWKDGKHKSHGYISVTKRDHPFASKMGKVPEHRLVMEKSLGRYLEPEEVVHHINGVLDDNRIENLKLFPNNKIHMQFHYDNRVIILFPPN